MDTQIGEWQGSAGRESLSAPLGSLGNSGLVEIIEGLNHHIVPLFPLCSPLT